MKKQETSRFLLGPLEFLAGAMLLAMCLCVLAGVVFRYFFHIGLGWTEEAARYLQILIMFVGSAIAVHRWSHFQLSLLDQKGGPRFKRGTSVFAVLMVGLFSCALIRHGITLSQTNWLQESPMMGWSIGQVYLVVPISGALMLLFCISHLLRLLKGAPLLTVHAGHGTAEEQSTV